MRFWFLFPYKILFKILHAKLQLNNYAVLRVCSKMVEAYCIVINNSENFTARWYCYKSDKNILLTFNYGLQQTFINYLFEDFFWKCTGLNHRGTIHRNK